MNGRFFCLNFGLLLLLTAGCASPRPVLYPNAYYRSVGKDKAQQDIDAALTKAGSYGLEENTGRDHRQMAKSVSDTAVSSGTRTAIDAVSSGSVGTGGAATMAAGTTNAFFRWLFWSSKPNMHYRKFVNDELKARGYQIMGWE